jgi:hypothetical protein
VFLLGLFLALARVVWAWELSRRLVRSARPLAGRDWEELLRELTNSLGLKRRVQLYQTERTCMPLQLGILTPILLLPESAQSFSGQRRRMVLLHELAHVKRWDCLTHTLGQLACALHWWNPLAWLAQRLLGRARELATDDRVLHTGVRPSSYASELLDTARELAASELGWGVAMAEPTRLSGRLHRILDPRADHRPPGLRFQLVSVGLALGLLMPLSALRGSAAVRPAAAPPATVTAPDPSLEQLRAQVDSYFTPILGQAPAEVELTIDPVVQALSAEELLRIEQRFRPAGASIVALDPKSGAILGLCASGGGARNLAVQGEYEPASTLKVFTVAAALDAGTIRPEQSFLTEKGSLQSGGGVVRDATPSSQLTAADILALSSNIGTIRIYRTLGKPAFLQALTRFHFGERPAIELPAAAGTPLRLDWSDAQVEAASFGHGFLVSPVQLAAGFAAVANQGIYNPPTLVRQAKRSDGVVVYQPVAHPEQVIKPATAAAVLSMLEGVVERDDGTGTNARVPGYRVAGKTGTGKRTGYFVGAVPAAQPRLVLLVMVDGPEGLENAYGNTVAAPSFRRLAEQILPHLQVPPQNPR